MSPALRPGARYIAFALALALVGGTCAGCFQTTLPGKSFAGDLAPLSNDQIVLRGSLKRHVDMLASQIGERNLLWKYDALNSAADYIEREFTSCGYVVQSQRWTERGKPVSNLIAELAGTSRQSEIVVIGAHYDTVGGSPGADDNASGVAALLEIAHAMRDQRPARTIRFVAFTNEESPFFWTNRMGSAIYARECRWRGDNVVAMISLEMLGCYDAAPGSQHYPPPFGLIYPSTGDFVGFLCDYYSRSLLDDVGRSFRKRTPIPSMGLASAQFVTGHSDQWSFWMSEYPAVMATDTAMFRNSRYHEASDTPDTLDYDRMTHVVGGLIDVVRDLSDARP